MKRQRTVYEAAIDHGFSRRDFLEMCTALAATLGLDYTQSHQVVKAMEIKNRVPVVWLQFQDCTGCSESFIRSSQPKTESVLLEMISLEYSEVLSVPSGHQAEASMKQVLIDYKGEYILAVEGSIPDDDAFLTVGGVSAKETFLEMASGAQAIIAYGSFSSWGGIAAAHPNPTGAKPVTRFIKDTPSILVPGCPPISEVMTGVIAHIITFGKLPELDHFGRPKAFYRHRIHDKCNRRAYFDAGLIVESFDDEGAKQGYCLYNVGCKGPTTYNSCAEMRWNGGVSYPIQSGNPCFGCSEQDFWDNGPFYTRRAKIPGTQTTINPDTVGLAVICATTAGIAVHATGTVIQTKIGVAIVAGDTKVVERGSADGVYINTTGIGIYEPGIGCSLEFEEGDAIIVTGTIGDHGIAVLAARGELGITVPINSDCASLNRMIVEVLYQTNGVRIMRDPTRGGLATTIVEIAEDFHLIMKINEVDLPVREEVHGVCDLLGFDPLYLANEGKSIIIVAANEADKVIDILSEFPEGRDAVVIGSITGKQKGQLLLETPLGSKRLLNRLSGTMFPRMLNKNSLFP